MVDVVLLCSGQPGCDGPFSCLNIARVRLVTFGRWKRPMCVPCADAFDAHLVSEELPPGQYVEIDPPAYEPPTVTPIGNFNDLLARCCSPRAE